MQPVTPVFVLPTADDLSPLYNATEAYRKVSYADWSRWNEVKEQSGLLPNHFEAAKIAYADPEIKRLKALQETLYNPMISVVAKLNNQFPGLALQSPAAFIMHSDTIDNYTKSVNQSIFNCVEDKWATANKESVLEIGTQIRKGRIVATAKFRPGMIVYRTGMYLENLLRVVKITHNGNRINLFSPIDGQSLAINVKDNATYRRVNAGLAKTLTRFAQHRIAFLAPYLASQGE